MDFKLVFVVLTIVMILPGASFGSCTYLKDDGRVMKGIDFSKKYNQKEEVQFVDPTGVRREAIVRSYCADDCRMDILLYDATNRVAKIDVIDQAFGAGPIVKAKAVRIHSGYDSIFIENNERHNGPGSDLLTFIDPTTCEQISGSLYFSGYDFADFDKIKAPKYEKEKAYFEKEAADAGVPTKELAVRESANPKWANYIWVLNNEAMLKENAKGRLKLQWYPTGDKGCSASAHIFAGSSNSATPNSKGSYSYKKYKLTGPSGAEAYKTVEVCDAEEHQWAPLFLAEGYKEFVNSLILQGPNATITTRYQTVNINLDHWEWSELRRH